MPTIKKVQDQPSSLLETSALLSKDSVVPAVASSSQRTHGRAKSPLGSSVYVVFPKVFCFH